MSSFQIDLNIFVNEKLARYTFKNIVKYRHRVRAAENRNMEVRLILLRTKNRNFHMYKFMYKLLSQNSRPNHGKKINFDYH